MLLCLSSRRWRSVLEEPVEVAGEVAFEAAVGLAAGFAFADPAFDVRDRGRMDSASGGLPTSSPPTVSQPGYAKNSWLVLVFPCLHGSGPSSRDRSSSTSTPESRQPS